MDTSQSNPVSNTNSNPIPVTPGVSNLLDSSGQSSVNTQTPVNPADQATPVVSVTPANLTTVPLLRTEVEAERQVTPTIPSSSIQPVTDDKLPALGTLDQPVTTIQDDVKVVERPQEAGENIPKAENNAMGSNNALSNIFMIFGFVLIILGLIFLAAKFIEPVNTVACDTFSISLTNSFLSCK